MRPISKWVVGGDGGGVDVLSVAMGGAWWVWMDGDGGFSKMFGRSRNQKRWFCK